MKPETVDVLALGAHPDDIELTVGGTLLVARTLGLSTAICHLTAGEMGTRGSVQQRQLEAQNAAAVLGVDHMEILKLPDGRLDFESEATTQVVVELVRKYRPKTILAPHIEDLHPDHAALGRVMQKASFFAGLAKWSPGSHAPWRPESLLYYMSHSAIEPHLIVDISDVFEKKYEAARCYVSQFHDPKSTERPTFISGENFWHWWSARAAYFGHFIGVKYGEPFFLQAPIPSRNPFSLFSGFGKYKNS